MCWASHSETSRVSRIWSSGSRRARVQPRHVHARDSLRRPILLAPARHAAGEEPTDRADADGGREVCGEAAVGVVAAYVDDLLVAAGDPGQAAAETRAQRRDADRARYVRLVELVQGPDVDE